MDNHFCTFKPHILLARVGQQIVIKNSDPPPIGHNTNIELFAFNQTVPSNDKIEIKDTAGLSASEADRVWHSSVDEGASVVVGSSVHGHVR